MSTFAVISFVVHCYMCSAFCNFYRVPFIFDNRCIVLADLYLTSVLFLCYLLLVTTSNSESLGKTDVTPQYVNSSSFHKQESIVSCPHCMCGETSKCYALPFVVYMRVDVARCIFRIQAGSQLSWSFGRPACGKSGFSQCCGDGASIKVARYGLARLVAARHAIWRLRRTGSQPCADNPTDTDSYVLYLPHASTKKINNSMNCKRFSFQMELTSFNYYLLNMLHYSEQYNSI